ncbi:MAG: FecR domain-containing protein [Lacunisphaera sp.]|nr:FecR domain-containing protein [Lacunisphaera sp.]
MKDPAPSSTPPNSIEDQAAAWVLRQDRGLTAAEQDEFLHWLMIDWRHPAALARHRQNWDRLNLLGQWRPEHSARPNRDLLAPPPAKVVRFPRTWITGLSLAAAAALAFVAYVQWSVAPAPTENPVSTHIAAIEELTLPDGSVVQLNRGSQVAVDYTPAERRVRLVRGEAHFTVAHNTARTFIVSASGVDVRAVGTAFDVRLGRSAVEVLVTEGKVRVDQENAAAAGGRETVVSELGLGERAVVPLVPVSTPPRVAVVPPEQASEMLAWQPKMLEFTSAPLRGVVAEFNRCNAPVHLVIADTDLADVEVSASLRSDNVEGFIRLLEAGFSVRADRTDGTITLRRR